MYCWKFSWKATEGRGHLEVTYKYIHKLHVERGRLDNWRASITYWTIPQSHRYLKYVWNKGYQHLHNSIVLTSKWEHLAPPPSITFCPTSSNHFWLCKSALSRNISDALIASYWMRGERTQRHVLFFSSNALLEGKITTCRFIMYRHYSWCRMCISVRDQSKTVDVYVRKDWLDGDLLSCPPGAPRGSPVQRSQGRGPGKPPCSGQRAPHRPDLPAGSPGSGGQTLSGTSPASSSPPTQTTTWDLNTGRHRGQRIYSATCWS